MSTTSAADVRTQTVAIWNGRIDLRVQVQGSGPPLLYLHPAGGMSWDGFLHDLATDHTVYAPEFPGTTPGDPDAITKLDDVFDASPAIAGSQLFLRGKKSLYCLAATGRADAR